MSEDETATPREQVLFLARAESRVRIVETLATTGAVTQRDLRTRLGASRTTVSRALQSLEGKGWVEKSGTAYRLTHAGEIVATEFGRLLETVRGVEDLGEFFRWFPSDLDAPDFHAASGLEVTYSTDADPYAPARKQSEILQTADRLQVLLPAIDLESTRTISEQVTDHGLEVETVVSPDVESTMASEEFAPLIREMARTGRAPVFVVRDELPFYLGLAGDGRVQVGLADDDGLPRALLETTDDDVREWAEDVYRGYRARATRKSASEF